MEIADRAIERDLSKFRFYTLEIAKMVDPDMGPEQLEAVGILLRFCARAARSLEAARPSILARRYHTAAAGALDDEWLWRRPSIPTANAGAIKRYAAQSRGEALLREIGRSDLADRAYE